jgi:formate/nitrite transporter
MKLGQDNQTQIHKTTFYDPMLNSQELQKTISALGIKKANTHPWQLFLLGILAGLYIALGAQVFLVALTEGMGKIVAGVAFSVGLVLVLIAGAELFTGNIIMIVGTMSHVIALRNTLRNWITVYLGNFCGALVCAILIWKSGLLAISDRPNAIALLSVNVAEAKLSLSFSECVIRGILCNMLVILAIIMATMSKDIVSKILCCILPIMTFVACGFEHCVANMYLIPLGLLSKGIPLSDQLVIFKNILPVTLGNIIGGLSILLIHPNRIRQIKFLIDKFKDRKPRNL